MLRNNPQLLLHMSMLKYLLTKQQQQQQSCMLYPQRNMQKNSNEYYSITNRYDNNKDEKKVCDKRQQ